RLLELVGVCAAGALVGEPLGLLEGLVAVLLALLAVEELLGLLAQLSEVHGARLPRSAERESAARGAVPEQRGQAQGAARRVRRRPQPAVHGGLRLVLPRLLVRGHP